MITVAWIVGLCCLPVASIGEEDAADMVWCVLLFAIVLCCCCCSCCCCCCCECLSIYSQDHVSST
jgi:hypothetical protein